MGLLDEIAKQKIEEAIQSGEWNNLPNKGQKLNLDEDPNTPEHLRLGNKLLRDAKVLPDWMQHRKEAEHFVTRIQRQWQNMEHTGGTLRRKWLNTGSREVRQKYLKWRATARLQWAEAVKTANSEILSATLKSPRAYRTIAPLKTEDEMRRFDATFPD
jgi:hypothetical protein